MMDHVDDGFRLGYRIGKDERLRDVPLVMLSGVAAETGKRFDGEAGGLRAWSRLERFIDKPVTGAQVLAVDRGARGRAGGSAAMTIPVSLRARILVVDDEYGVRSGIRTILEMEGYDVMRPATAPRALAALEERVFDVALLDYRLPDTDGLSLLQRMKQRGCDAMVCMITAYANIDTAIAATRQGVDFFLPKPFSPGRPRGRRRHAAAPQAGTSRGRAAAPRARGEPARARRRADADAFTCELAARRRAGGEP